MLSLRITSTLKEGGKQDFPFYLIISFSDIWVGFVEETLFKKNLILIYFFKFNFNLSRVRTSPSKPWLVCGMIEFDWYVQDVKFKCWHSLQMKQNKWFL